MGRVTWLALGLLAFGGCSLAGSWSHRERSANVPRMTCDQLLRDGPGPDGLVTLTDARLCRRGHVGRRDAIHPGERVLIIDDLLATGGTAEAAIRLIRRIGGDVVEMAFVVELAFLKGRGRLAGIPVYSMVVFE